MTRAYHQHKLDPIDLAELPHDALVAYAEALRFYLEELTTPISGPVALTLDLDVRLTPQERRVLGSLLHSLGRTLSKEALLAAIMADRPQAEEPDIKIVDVLIFKIRARLAAAESPITIRTVRGAGYVIDKPPLRNTPDAALAEPHRGLEAPGPLPDMPESLPAVSGPLTASDEASC